VPWRESGWLPGCSWQEDIGAVARGFDVKRREAVALAGAADAQSVLGFEQGTMGGAHDERTTRFHELVGPPVEFYTQMRATIEIGSQRAIVLEDKYRRFAVQAAALAFLERQKGGDV